MGSAASYWELVEKRVQGDLTFSSYYLRSSVLGGQMVAIQGGGAVSWVHQDPITKSQRITNSSGAVTSIVDLDPWDGETGRQQQLRIPTSSLHVIRARREWR